MLVFFNFFFFFFFLFNRKVGAISDPVFWIFANFICNFVSFFFVFRISAMLACFIIAVCMAIAGNHSTGLPAVAASGDGNESLKQPCRECITAFPSAEAVGVECMPLISVPQTAMSRTSRVQQVRVGGGQGNATGSTSHTHAHQRRTASGSLRIFGTSSPMCCNFMKDYYIYMLRRIVI